MTRQRITFSRRSGGFVVSFNGDLTGLILSPENDGGTLWRYVSQWGDVPEHTSLCEAQEHASSAVLLDAHYPA